MTIDLNLECVKPFLHELAIKAYDEQNIASVLSRVGSDTMMEFVIQNRHLLMQNGMYEKALLFAYTSPRNNHRWSPGFLKTLFNYANRERLQEAGDPIPDGDTFIIYRGVATNKNRQDRIRVPSWTNDFEKAVWFANWQSDLFPNRAVYKAVVDRNEILAYMDDRNENEFIVFPKRYTKVNYDFKEVTNAS